MNFAFTEEQLELQEVVREFVEKEITPIAGEMDAENATRPELFKMAADIGLLNVIVPEEYGGLGLDSVTVAMMYEELGKGLRRCGDVHGCQCPGNGSGTACGQRRPETHVV